ncbi:MAG: hypothetical protein WAV25_02355 [Minisyncoccia bacterium]
MPNIEYKIITDPCQSGNSVKGWKYHPSTLSGLAILVNDAIREGWEPLGAPVADKVRAYYDTSLSAEEDSGSMINEWSQAMIRRKQ